MTDRLLVPDLDCRGMGTFDLWDVPCMRGLDFRALLVGAGLLWLNDDDRGRLTTCSLPKPSSLSLSEMPSIKESWSECRGVACFVGGDATRGVLLLPDISRSGLSTSRRRPDGTEEGGLLGKRGGEGADKVSPTSACCVGVTFPPLMLPA